MFGDNIAVHFNRRIELGFVSEALKVSRANQLRSPERGLH